MVDADWRSAERYAAMCEMSPADLAWEFLRRNPQYQDDFARHADAPQWAARWGLSVPADPALSAADQPIFWSPAIYPRTVVLTAAPSASSQTAPFTPHNWPGRFVERRADDGLHALLITTVTQHRLWLPDGLALGDPVACVVPMGLDTATAAAAALQFWRHLKGDPPPARRALDGKFKRALLSLQALDGHIAGDTYRTLAARLFGPRIADESWRTSSLRDATIRLVRSGVALASGRHQRLLKPRIEE